MSQIDAVIPAAVAPGKKTTVTIYGRSLPGGKPAPSGLPLVGALGRLWLSAPRAG